MIPNSGLPVDGQLTVADLVVASPFVNMQHIWFRPDVGKYPSPSLHCTIELSIIGILPSWALTMASIKPSQVAALRHRSKRL